MNRLVLVLFALVATLQVVLMFQLFIYEQRRQLRVLQTCSTFDINGLTGLVAARFDHLERRCTR